jgi:hypothetical protein
VQEQLSGILRAALEATFAPMLEKQRELEAKLAWLHQEAESAKARAEAQSKKPVAAPAAPPRVRGSMHSVDITPSDPRVPARAPASGPVAAPRSSIVETSYGLVITQSDVRRSPMASALENVGPVDVTQLGRSRVSVGMVLVVLLLAAVAAAIVATALSYA